MLQCGAPRVFGQLAAIMLFVWTLGCASTDRESRSPYDEAVQAFVADGTFSGVVLVERAGEELFRSHYGTANKELDVPFTRGTRFRFHSLTKPLLSAAVLAAVAEGKLALDASICDSLDPCPSSWTPVTVRHLLNHTSGIEDFAGLLLEEWAGSLGATFDRIGERLSSLQPVTEPGTAWRYSNSGYVLLARLLERLDGRPIAEVMQRRVFGPAGMRNAGMEASPPWDESSYDTPLVVPRLATGYNGAPGRLQEASSRMYAIPGAGAAYGDADDLRAFARALFEGELLPAELRNAAVDVGERATVSYALGWVVRERHGARVYRHDGGNNGYLASLEYYPDQRLTVIVLSNLGFAPIEEIRDKLGEIALSE